MLLGGLGRALWGSSHRGGDISRDKETQVAKMGVSLLLGWWPQLVQATELCSEPRAEMSLLWVTSVGHHL